MSNLIAGMSSSFTTDTKVLKDCTTHDKVNYTLYDNGSVHSDKSGFIGGVDPFECIQFGFIASDTFPILYVSKFGKFTLYSIIDDEIKVFKIYDKELGLKVVLGDSIMYQNSIVTCSIGEVSYDAVGFDQSYILYEPPGDEYDITVIKPRVYSTGTSGNLEILSYLDAKGDIFGYTNSDWLKLDGTHASWGSLKSEYPRLDGQDLITITGSMLSVGDKVNLATFGGYTPIWNGKDVKYLIDSKGDLFVYSDFLDTSYPKNDSPPFSMAAPTNMDNNNTAIYNADFSIYAHKRYNSYDPLVGTKLHSIITLLYTNTGDQELIGLDRLDPLGTADPDRLPYIKDMVFAADGRLYVTIEDGYNVLVRNKYPGKYLDFENVIVNRELMQDHNLDTESKVGGLVATPTNVSFHYVGSHLLNEGEASEQFVDNSGLYILTHSHGDIVRVLRDDTDYPTVDMSKCTNARYSRKMYSITYTLKDMGNGAVIVVDADNVDKAIVEDGGLKVFSIVNASIGDIVEVMHIEYTTYRVIGSEGIQYCYLGNGGQLSNMDHDGNSRFYVDGPSDVVVIPDAVTASHNMAKVMITNGVTYTISKLNDFTLTISADGVLSQYRVKRPITLDSKLVSYRDSIVYINGDEVTNLTDNTINMDNLFDEAVELTPFKGTSVTDLVVLPGKVIDDHSNALAIRGTISTLVTSDGVYVDRNTNSEVTFTPAINSNEALTKIIGMSKWDTLCYTVRDSGNEYAIFEYKNTARTKYRINLTPFFNDNVAVLGTPLPGSSILNDVSKWYIGEFNDTILGNFKDTHMIMISLTTVKLIPMTDIVTGDMLFIDKTTESGVLRDFENNLTYNVGDIVEKVNTFEGFDDSDDITVVDGLKIDHDQFFKGTKSMVPTSLGLYSPVKALRLDEVNNRNIPTVNGAMGYISSGASELVNCKRTKSNWIVVNAQSNRDLDQESKDTMVILFGLGLDTPPGGSSASTTQTIFLEVDPDYGDFKYNPLPNRFPHQLIHMPNTYVLETLPPLVRVYGNIYAVNVSMDIDPQSLIWFHRGPNYSTVNMRVRGYSINNNTLLPCAYPVPSHERYHSYSDVIDNTPYSRNILNVPRDTKSLELLVKPDFPHTPLSQEVFNGSGLVITYIGTVVTGDKIIGQYQIELDGVVVHTVSGIENESPNILLKIHSAGDGQTTVEGWAGDSFTMDIDVRFDHARILQDFCGWIQYLTVSSSETEHSINPLNCGTIGKVVSYNRDIITGEVYAVVSPSSHGIHRNKGLLKFTFNESGKLVFNKVLLEVVDGSLDDLEPGDVGCHTNRSFKLIVVKKDGGFKNYYSRYTTDYVRPVEYEPFELMSGLPFEFMAGVPFHLAEIN